MFRFILFTFMMYRTFDLTSMTQREGRLMASLNITRAASHGWLYFPIYVFYSCAALLNHVVYATGLPPKSRQLQNDGNRTSKPTLATSSVAPSPMTPTLSSLPPNSKYPSAFPSLPASRSVEIEAAFLHQLVIAESRQMTETEEFLYEFIMENYTKSIGLGIGEPFIVSNCTVTSTTPVTVNVEQGNSTYDYGLLVNFKMEYVSRYGYNDTLNYPDYLLKFLNSNTEEVSAYLREVINIESDFIISSGGVVIVDPTGPTSGPSSVEGDPSSFLPTSSKYPSAFPSLPASKIVEIEAAFLHQLVIAESRQMTETEEFLYELIMENYTKSIGLGIGEPFIVSNCTVTSTAPVTVNVEHGNSTYDYGLLVNFKMEYVSRYGYNDTLNYPDYLLEFLNSNTEEVSATLSEVINIESDFVILSLGGVVIVDPTGPTSRPSNVEGRPSSPPSPKQSFAPSSSPSTPSTEYNQAPRALGIGSIVAIILGFILVALLSFIILKKLSKQKHHAEKPSAGNPNEERNGNTPTNINNEGGPTHAIVAMPIFDTDREEGSVYPKGFMTFNQISPMSQLVMKSSSMNSEESDTKSLTATGTAPSEQPNGVPSPTSTDYSVTTSRSKQQSDGGTIFGANLMIRGDSFSSDSNDEILSPQKASSIRDEFDKYKNQVLETLRNEVEKSIYNVDGMMSLAMTRILMEAEGTTLDLSWVGAEDPASIEASCYFEASDWRKQNETTISCTSESFFEDMLNRIVQIVHHGLIRPNDGARLLHGCASILNMQLIRELPNTTIVIRGLRKTNDLAQGHHFLIESFGVYGDIVDASISPKNRGYGFVRFVHPRSVAAVMKKYESSEIEIQDVSVFVVPLRDAHRILQG